MAFDPSRPFNDLPNLPPASDTETRATGCSAMPTINPPLLALLAECE